MFDEHVIACRVMSHIRAMEARGEIELNYSHQRTIKQIVKEVLQDFPEITINDLKRSGRHARICLARQTAIYEVRRQRPNLSYPAIGRWFGGRDHTKILHSVRKIEAMRGEA